MRTVASVFVVVLWIFVFWPKVESSDGYSYADCKNLQENQDTTQYGRRCFCYNSGRGIKWKDIWSTFQVRVTGNDDVVAVYPMGTRNCHNPNSFFMLAKCTMEHYWPTAVEQGQTLDIPLVEENVCFMIRSPRSSSEYTLHVAGKRLNKGRFALFLGGLLLFYLAGGICRSSIFYYTTGVTLGTVSILLLLLFVMKSFIPKRGVFLAFIGAGSGVSYLGLQRVMAAWEDITKTYWREMLGYLAVTGFISFALCYRRGPITCERTLNLMTWSMQIVALALMWAGISYPPAALTLLATLLSLKLVPLLAVFLKTILRSLWMLLCLTVGLVRRSRHRPKIRLLTEEEYREQGERTTRASLEQLREYCRTPGFPAWDTVVKLSNPQKFAEFLRGSSHVNSEEQDLHEERYGLGGAYNENTVFSRGRRGWGLLHDDEEDDQYGGGDDISEDELESYTRGPPTPNPIPTPSPALPHFPAYAHAPVTPTPQYLPYPPSPVAAPAPAPALYPSLALYPPLPEPMEVEEEEDEDLF